MQATPQSIAPSKAAQIRTIKAAYSELVRLDLQDGFREVARYLFNLNLVAERQHRKGSAYMPTRVFGISANVAAKLFTIEHLLEGWAEPDKWTVDHILSIRTEVLYAQAYAKKFHKQLEQWATKYSPFFLRSATDGKPSIDYTELMKA